MRYLEETGDRSLLFAGVEIDTGFNWRFRREHLKELVSLIDAYITLCRLILGLVGSL